MNEPRTPGGGTSPAESDQYSATALGSHWFERPAPHPVPDRVEGDVLRFGPGVTAFVHRRHNGGATAAGVWHGTLAGQPSAPSQQRRHRRGLRRYALATVVLVAVLAFLAWQRYGPQAAVRGVSVSASPAAGPGCDGTADVVGVVRTDGRPGTLTYRWIRSDGTSSGVLREDVPRGRKQARLHLLWTFHGRGEYAARAELRIISPSPRTASTSFTYRCP